MSTGLLWSVALALLLFWAVGAYNRLVRLRSQALQAFGALALQLQRRNLLAQGFGLPDAAEGGPPVAEAVAALAGLHAAAQQCAASLAAAKARPLDRPSMAALGAAQAVLLEAWQRLLAGLPERRGARTPDRQRAEWEQAALQLAAASDEFNQAVLRYNGAVAQFPASVLAAVFGLRRAGTL